MKRAGWTTTAMMAVGSCVWRHSRSTVSVRGYIKVDAPAVVLTNLRVIDGTGAPARPNQTVVIRGGNIESIGDAVPAKLPDGAVTLDLAGKSAIPGLVMVHEHLYYPTGPGVYGQLGESFVRLYLAGGVTTCAPVATSRIHGSPPQAGIDAGIRPVLRLIPPRRI